MRPSHYGIFLAAFVTGALCAFFGNWLIVQDLKQQGITMHEPCAKSDTQPTWVIPAQVLEEPYDPAETCRDWTTMEAGRIILDMKDSQFVIHEFTGKRLIAIPVPGYEVTGEDLDEGHWLTDANPDLCLCMEYGVPTD